MHRIQVFSRIIKCISLVCLLTFGSALAAQNKLVSTNNNTIEISGLVQDAHTKKPIGAAQITVFDKSASATTDEKGNFKIKVSSLHDALFVSAYEYNNVEIPLKSRTTVVVDLYTDQFSTFFRKVDGVLGLVNNTSTTNSSKSVTDFPIPTSVAIDDAMQSEFGGDVRAIKRSAIAGIGSSLFIRGINTLNANAQPLFVVDGVIWESNSVESIHAGFFSNPLDVIDMNDVESITVLKDGFGIYGSKAANGVVLIKTKRSTSEVTKIGLNIFTGITTRPRTIPMMSADQYKTYASDMLNSKSTVGNDISSYGFLNTDPNNIKVYSQNHNNTDWSDEVYQNGVTNNYLMSVNGGDLKAKYYVSLGYTTSKGIVKTTNFDRYSLRFNADINLTRKLTMGINLGFSYLTRKLVDDGVSNYSSPTWISQVKPTFLSPYNYTNSGGLTTDYAFTDEFGIGNPGAIINYTISTLKKNRFNVSISPVYKLSSDLAISTLLDYNTARTNEGRYIPMLFTPQRMIPEYGISYNDVSNQVLRNSGIYNDSKLTYQKSIDKSNHIKAILGWRYISNDFEYDYIEEHNTGSNNNTTITGDFEFLQVEGKDASTRSISNYLSADYDFQHKLFLNATVSMDGSSRFGKETESGVKLFGRSWAVFPSVNGAWLLSSESFMKNVNVISFCKFRAGYGLTGNDGINDYQTRAYFISNRFLDKSNGLVISNLGNEHLQWETTGKFNTGVDLSLFKDRLMFTFDYFNSKTRDLLVLKDLPDISGLGKYWTNSGKLSNEGFEISANVKLLNLRSLKWELGASAGHYKNCVTELPNGEYTTSVYDGEVITRVGESVGSFYGYKTLGVFATQAAADAANLKMKNADGTYAKFGAGDVIFEDTKDATGKKDGIIDENDKQVIGNPNPDVYGTITNKISYKNISLSAVLAYSYGNDVYNYYRSQLEAGKDFNNQSSIMINRWTADGQATTQPKAVYGDPMGNSRFSNRWIEDGSYIRLKTVTLSYDLQMKSKYISGINFWVSANNLLTLTKYLGIDPEFSSANSAYCQGVDAGLLPQTKSYYVGVKFSL